MTRRRLVAAAALVVGAILTGCGSTPSGSPADGAAVTAPAAPEPTSEPAPPSAAVPPIDATERPAPVGARDVDPVAASPPVSIEVPRLGVSSGLERLGLVDGAVAAPRDWDTAGWFADGAEPGQPGSAVIAGHVDSVSGPAVFYELGQLVAGDEVRVGRADGSTLRFVVTGSGTFEKDRFPSELVYGPATEPALRLVTCGGRFDAGTGHYLSNVVVFAALAG